MSIETFGALGEMIGALAVLVSLIYLAKQIKHSSEVAKISSYHEGIVQIIFGGWLILADRMAATSEDEI